VSVVTRKRLLHQNTCTHTENIYAYVYIYIKICISSSFVSIYRYEKRKRYTARLYPSKKKNQGPALLMSPWDLATNWYNVFHPIIYVYICMYLYPKLLRAEMSPVGNETQFFIFNIIHISNMSKVKYNVNSTGVRGEVLSEEEDEDEDESDASEYTFACNFCGKEFDSLNGATCHENLHCKQRPRGGGGGGGWRWGK